MKRGNNDEIISDDTVMDGSVKTATNSLYSYPGFDILMYVVIGVVIFGLIFVLLIKKFCEPKIIDRPLNKSKIYGSFYQMV